MSMDSSELKRSQLSDKKKAVLVICIFSCVGLIGYVLRVHLSDWGFLAAIITLLVILELVSWLVQGKNKGT